MNEWLTGVLSRRALVRNLTLAMGAAAVLPAGRAGAEPARLDVKDPMAVALGYVEDATKVDVKANPTYVAKSNCENCLQLQGKPGDAFRPCAIFPGKLVSANGWCKSWAPEI